MYWNQGDTEQARAYFERAIQLGPYHEFTLIYYAKFLLSVGDNDYAYTLRRRLAEVDPDTRYRAPAEYELMEDD